MADIGNQLEGATEGLDRFIDSLDEVSIRLGSNAALEAKLARAKQKEIRVDAQTMKQKKFQLKNLTDLNKAFKEVGKNMKDFAKQSLGKIGQGMKMAGKAGAIGVLITGIKVLIDGLLKLDTQMGKLVARLGMTRKELAPMKKSIIDAHAVLGQFGMTFEQVAEDAANLTEAFGKVPQDLTKMVNVSMRLQKVYGVSAQHAASLVTSLERANTDSREFVDNIGKRAQKAGVLTTLVMRGMAANAEMFAIQTDRGRESMMNMAVDMAKAGGTVDEIKGLEAAFVDFEKVQANISSATSIFGTDISRNMGDIQALYKAAIEGDFDYIRKREKMTMDALFRYDKKSGKLLTAKSKFTKQANYIERKELEKLYGRRFELLRNETIQRQRANDASDKEYEKESKRLAVIERENKLMQERKNVFQRLIDVVSGVYERIMVQFSKALGIDETGPGTIHGMIDALQADVEEIFNFTDMQKQISDEGGGVGGFIKILGQKLEKLGDWLFKGMKDGLVKLMAWFDENYEYDILEGGFVQTKQGIVNAQNELVEGLKEEKDTLNAIQNKRAELEKNRDADFAAYLKDSKEKEKAELRGAGLHLELTKKKGETEKAFAEREAEREKAKLETHEKYQQQRGNYILRRHNKIASLGKDEIEQQETIQDVQKQIAAGAEGARVAQRDVDIKKGMEDNIVLNAVDYVISDAIISTVADADEALSKAVDFIGENLSPEKTPVKSADAMGRVHHRAGAAIVGEAGGEVVASRSALRTGIGISGRAAQELAGIGVPGYYSGAAISGSFSRQGLAGDVGSVTFQEAQATAFIAEQRVQQAEMMNYWRREYTRQMDEAAEGAKEERKKDGVAWGKYAKEFFKKYPSTVDYALQKAFNIQGGVSAEIYKGVFSGMQKWSEGSSIKDALNHGFSTAVAGSLKSGSLKKFLDGLKESNQHLHTVVQGALGSYAATGSFKQAGGAMLQAGGGMLIDRYLGGNDMREAHALLGGSTLGNISNQVERNARNAGYGSGSVPGAAMGKYVSSPHLMMVGEEGRGEVVIPTERIRKGLPINAGVARELGSIGVPGFMYGDSYQVGDIVAPKKADSVDIGKNLAKSSNISGYLQGQGSFADAGGFKALGKAGLGSGLLTGLSTWQQTGDWKQGVTAGVGAAAGMGIAAGLMSVGVPPPLNTMIGGFAGQLIGKGLNSVFGITGGQKDARKRVASQLTKYVQATRPFGIGKPGGLKKQMNIAIGGKENAPTEANYNKLKEKIGGVSVLNPVFGAGVSPDVLIALGTRQMLGSQASSAYSAINTSLYGHAGGTEMMRSMRTLGDGGIVTRPTQALIGERGPEAVIPLDQQQARDRDMINEMKKQNKLMMEMIKTQKETGGTEIRLDGRVIAESVSDHQYSLANGVN